MKSPWKTTLAGGSILLALSASALAQTPPPPLAASAAPLYDPQQLPAQRGKVQQFTLTPRGDIDGLILTDGTEVKTPPHLSTQIAFAIKPGDAVTVHGLRAAALPLVQAVSITNDATGQTIVDNGPARPAAAPPPPFASVEQVSGPLPGLTQLQGRVRMALHGPQGDVNGALLEDGTILRLPPPEAYRFAKLLQPGQTLVATGTALVTPAGKVMQAQQIGASSDQLSLVRQPPRPGKGGKGGKGKRPPPAPDAGVRF
ncbi:MAG: hypothetical protein FWD62_10130 [Betaproteobacteria bacterium]|nr:hypothetical protein [Betaproteobacteria bacterium]